MSDDPVREWAKVKLALREAQDRVLKVEGHTWQSLKELEANAISQLAGQSYLDSEYGRVHVVETPMYLRKNAQRIGETKRLKLTETQP